MSPRVSFLLPVHNHAGTVGATVESVLGQTYGDLELVVIDDASTDGSADVLRGFKDARVRVHRNSENLELTRSLNVGLEMVRGEFVARIDADDLCLPERAARQVAFLDARPDVAVLGSFVETMDEAGKALGVVKYPTEPEDIAPAFLFRNPIAHPAVMFRRRGGEVGEMRYDAKFRRGQDFELWVRCVLAGLKLANVPEVLTRYRVHGTQVSQRDAGGVRETGALVRTRLIAALKVDVSPKQLQMHERLAWDELEEDHAWLRSASLWLELLYVRNMLTYVFNEDALGKTLCGRWVALLKRAKTAGLNMSVKSSLLAPYLSPGALP